MFLNLFFYIKRTYIVEIEANRQSLSFVNQNTKLTLLSLTYCNSNIKSINWTGVLRSSVLGHLFKMAI